jgi:hypothetical protein
MFGVRLDRIHVSHVQARMAPHFGFALAAVGSFGCGATTLDAMPTFTFRQEHANLALPPTFQTDIVLPSGTQTWRLVVSCSSHGRRCRSGYVDIMLGFAVPDNPGVSIVVIPAGGRSEPPSPTTTCFEDWVNGRPADPQRTKCTLIAHSGWEADDSAGGPHDFLARIENTGAPLPVHVTLGVIDPLE